MFCGPFLCPSLAAMSSWLEEAGALSPRSQQHPTPQHEETSFVALYSKTIES